MDRQFVICYDEMSPEERAQYRGGNYNGALKVSHCINKHFLIIICSSNGTATLKKNDTE
jgi:hypothetical protein